MTIVDGKLHFWEKIITNKWLILDANTIINLIKYKEDNNFLDRCNSLKVNLITIQPIVLELYRTNSSIERTQRNTFLDNVEVITIDENLRKNSEEIQKEMWTEDYYPEPEDLYLASTIKKFSNGKTLLATSNLDDFREPLFKRDGFISLSDKKSICIISLLSFNQTN